MSVFAGDLMESNGRTHQDALREHDGFGLVALNAGFVRGRGQTVGLYNDDADDPEHAYVAGKKTKGVKRAFCKNAEWLVPTG
ncbi:MAG: hypothetical protein ABIP48_10985 [Planctomycetota bacterium]